MGIFDHSLRGPFEKGLDVDVPEQIKVPLAGGLAGNYQTVRYMSSIAHQWKDNPLVRSLAAQAVSSVPSHNYADESIAVGEFVKSHVRYVQDPTGVEQLTTPDTMSDQIKRRGMTQGDCDDMALTVTLLLAIGHEPFFRLVRYQGTNGPYNHIYVVDYARDGAYGKPVRIVLDAIVKDKPMGFEITHASGEEVKV